MPRVGLLGGTFDPVHLGHLIAAEEAHSVLRLSRVLFIPAADPPHKKALPTPIHHRLAMLELALADNPHLAISRVDVDRKGPHYTVDMLRLMQLQLGPGTRLYFVMGVDSLQDLPTWRQPERIVQLARLAVVSRPGIEPDLEVLEKVVPGLRGAVQWVQMPLVGISATDLRRRVASGRPIRYQVPPLVADYIATHRLYRRSSSPAEEQG